MERPELMRAAPRNPSYPTPDPRSQVTNPQRPPVYSHAPIESPQQAPADPYAPQYLEQYPPQFLQPQPRELREIVDEGADRTLSAVAHGAIAFGFLGFTLLISLAISGFLWLYGKRSRQVRFHSEQAGCFQVIVLLVNIFAIIALGITGGFAIFQNFQGQSDLGTPWLLFVGLIAFGLWFFGTILYGIYGAVMVMLGRDFKYPVIGDWAKKRTS